MNPKDISKEFLMSVKQDGDTDPFASFDKQEKKETPAESSAEIKPKTETAPSQSGAGDEKKEEPATPSDPKPSSTDDKNVPFHKHPDWIAREKQWEERVLKQQQDFDKKLSDELSKFETKISSAKPGQAVKVPEWLSTAIGNDEVIAQQYSQYEQSLITRAKEEIFKEMQSKQQHAQQEQDKWKDWTNQSIQKVEAEFKVDLSSKDQTGENKLLNEFVAYLLDVQPMGTDGGIDVLKGWKKFDELRTLKNAQQNTNTNTARKQIADIASPSPKSESKDKGFMTSNDFKGKGWKQIIK